MSKQIEFPPNQTHKKSFEMGMLAGCAIGILIAVIAVIV